jgi:hypothetical protein
LKKRKTAGELSLQVQKDTTIYDELEVAHALTEDIAQSLLECVRKHNPIFDEDEYCVGYVLASDPLIKNIMRRKYFAMLYMPSPRPDQTIFLYNKKKDQITKCLWVLPCAAKMAILSETKSVPIKYMRMKAWCDAFFKLNFWPYIRKMHGIDMLSESEYLNANREKLIKSGCKEVKTLPSEPFDFSKVTVNKIVDAKTAFAK